MIVNKYNYGGGGSGSGVTPQDVQQQIDSALTPYWESAETQSAITLAVSGLASEQYVQDALSGVSLDGYWNSAQTQSAITAVEDHLNDVEQVTASAYTELHEGLMEVSARTVDLSPFWNSAQTESAITMAVAGKADAKILVDFDHTSQAERASIYAELKTLYDGGSGATINKNYDFYKTVNTWQGQKIDYYTFSGDTLVFGQVVSPENTADQVVYAQVMTIDSGGGVNVVTNIVGGGASGGNFVERAESESTLIIPTNINDNENDAYIGTFEDGFAYRFGEERIFNIHNTQIDRDGKVTGHRFANEEYALKGDVNWYTNTLKPVVLDGPQYDMIPEEPGAVVPTMRYDGIYWNKTDGYQEYDTTSISLWFDSGATFASAADPSDEEDILTKAEKIGDINYIAGWNGAENVIMHNEVYGFCDKNNPTDNYIAVKTSYQNADGAEQASGFTAMIVEDGSEEWHVFDVGGGFNFGIYFNVLEQDNNRLEVVFEPSENSSQYEGEDFFECYRIEANTNLPEDAANSYFDGLKYFDPDSGEWKDISAGGGLPVGYEAIGGYINEDSQIVTVDGKVFGEDLYDVPRFVWFETGYSDEERGYVVGNNCNIFGYYDGDDNFVPVFLPAGTYAVLNNDDFVSERQGKVMNLYYGKVGDEDVIYNNEGYAQDLDSISLVSPLFTITEPTCPTTEENYYELYLDYTDKPSAQSQIDTLDEVVSQAILDLNDRVDAISAATPDLSPYWSSGETQANILSAISSALVPYYTSAQTEDAISSALIPYYTSAQTNTAISAATQNMVTSTDVRHIVKLTQAAYDQLVLDDDVDPYTFYIIVNNI